MSGDLSDTTEMYLRTVYELLEEGVVPLRARIAERRIQGSETFPAKVTLEVAGLAVNATFDGEIRLQ